VKGVEINGKLRPAACYRRTIRLSGGAACIEAEPREARKAAPVNFSR